MRKHWMTVCSLILCATVMPAFAGQAATNEPLQKALYMGKMDAAFWRTTPMPDRGHFTGAPIIYPGSPQNMTFLQDTDFPYNFKKYGVSPDKPYLFHTDEIVMVRFLGGWDGKRADVEPYDLAYRDEKGVIQLRRELLRRHFEKYEASGVVSNYTIVLDNVPYCFPKNPALGPFGQVEPPADLNEWHAFIVSVCEEIKAVLGEERANRIRFRLGTEMQGNNQKSGHNRFNGTQDEFFAFYKTTAEAVREVLPGAKFGPWNIAGVDQGLDVHLIDYRQLAKFCADSKLPLDFIGQSLYFVPLFGEQSPLEGVTAGDWNRLTNTDPAEKIKFYTDFWDELFSINPALKNVPREIQEFGVLDNELALPSVNMDAQLSSRDAAEMLQAMFLLKKAGATKWFHWGLSNPIPGTGRHILNSNGWLLEVLDQTTGGDIWELPVKNLSRRSISKSMALGFFNCDNGKNYLIVPTFNTYRYIHMPEPLEITVPEGLIKLAGRTVRMVSLDVTDSPQRVMRDDLAAAGLLTDDYRLHPDFPPMNSKGLLPSAVTDMKAAESLIKQNEGRYVDICSRSLKLKPFSAQFRSENGNTILPVSTRASSVLVFEIE